MNDKMFFLTHVADPMVEAFPDLDALRDFLEFKNQEDVRAGDYLVWSGEAKPYKPDQSGWFVVAIQAPNSDVWEYHSLMNSRDTLTRVQFLSGDRFAGCGWKNRVFTLTELRFRVVPAHIEFLPLKETP